MLLKMYSIRDAKGEFYNNPFMKLTHGEAERDFLMLAKDQASMISKFPEDFDLYYLGEYENKTGKMTLLDSPQHMVKAVDLKSIETGAH